MEEQWKKIKNFPWYEVSDHGRIRSLPRCVKNRRDVSVYHEGKILKPQPNSNGYLRVKISNESDSYIIFVHRLVASAFCEKPINKNIVNHKDFNYLNNHASNLEWTTRCGNMKYSADAGRFKKTKKWIDNIDKGLNKVKTPVIGICIETGECIEFEGINKAKRYGFEPSCICNCCKGIRKTHKGYIWKYKVKNNELCEV